MSVRLKSAVWLILAFKAACQGATNAPASLALPDTAASATLSLIRVAGALALVMAVFFGGLWLFRNWERLAARRGRLGKLTIRETRSLGQRHALFVIGYERQRMLVAVSPTGVSLLTALPSEEGEEPVMIPEATAARASGFSGLLAQVLARRP